MAEPKKITHVKCKMSVSLGFNNLTSSEANLCYLHRNEAHILRQRHMNQERANSAVAAYTETAPLLECSYVTLTCGECLVLINMQGQIFVFNANGDKLKTSMAVDMGDMPRARRLYGIAGKGSVLAVGSGNGVVHAYRCNATGDSFEKIASIQHSDPVTALTVEGDLLIGGDEQGQVCFWDLAQGGERVGASKPTGYPCVTLKSGHGFAVGGFTTGHLRMYSLANKCLRVEITAHTRIINAVSIHKTKPMVCCASEDTFISVWNIPTKANREIVSMLMVSPNSSLLTGVAWVGDKVASTAYDSRYISLIELDDI